MVEIRLIAADGDWLVGIPVQVSLPSDTPAAGVASSDLELQSLKAAGLLR